MAQLNWLFSSSGNRFFFNEREKYFAVLDVKKCCTIIRSIYTIRDEFVVSVGFARSRRSFFWHFSRCLQVAEWLKSRFTCLLHPLGFHPGFHFNSIGIFSCSVTHAICRKFPHSGDVQKREQHCAKSSRTPKCVSRNQSSSLITLISPNMQRVIGQLQSVIERRF